MSCECPGCQLEQSMYGTPVRSENEKRKKQPPFENYIEGIDEGVAIISFEKKKKEQDVLLRKEGSGGQS